MTRLTAQYFVEGSGGDKIHKYRVYFDDSPGNDKDWIGLYHKTDTPGSDSSLAWEYVSNKTSGSVDFTVPVDYVRETKIGPAGQVSVFQIPVLRYKLDQLVAYHFLHDGYQSDAVPVDMPCVAVIPGATPSGSARKLTIEQIQCLAVSDSISEEGWAAIITIASLLGGVAGGALAGAAGFGAADVLAGIAFRVVGSLGANGLARQGTTLTGILPGLDDHVYIKYNGQKVWPASSYTNMNKLDTQTVNYSTVVGSYASDIEVYDYDDVTSDDLLAKIRFEYDDKHFGEGGGYKVFGDWVIATNWAEKSIYLLKVRIENPR